MFKKAIIFHTKYRANFSVNWNNGQSENAALAKRCIYPYRQFTCTLEFFYSGAFRSINRLFHRGDCPNNSH